MAEKRTIDEIEYVNVSNMEISTEDNVNEYDDMFCKFIDERTQKKLKLENELKRVEELKRELNTMDDEYQKLKNNKFEHMEYVLQLLYYSEDLKDRIKKIFVFRFDDTYSERTLADQPLEYIIPYKYFIPYVFQFTMDTKVLENVYRDRQNDTFYREISKRRIESENDTSVSRICSEKELERIYDEVNDCGTLSTYKLSDIVKTDEDGDYYLENVYVNEDNYTSYIIINPEMLCLDRVSYSDTVEELHKVYNNKKYFHERFKIGIVDDKFVTNAGYVVGLSGKKYLIYDVNVRRDA